VIAKVVERAAGSPLAAFLVDAGRLVAPLDLLEHLSGWEGAVVIADAVSSGAEPGALSIERLELGGNPSEFCGYHGGTSTHGIGILDAYHMACELGLAPRRLAIVGLEGADFSHGTGLSTKVAAALEDAAKLVLDFAAEVAKAAGAGAGAAAAAAAI
jgi:hydrogenase maturation protease